MITRRALLALALAAGVLSAALYLVAAQRVAVLVAARDIEAPRVLTAADVELRDVPPDLVPDGAIRSVDAGVGLTPTAPLLRGQLLLVRGLARDAHPFASGLAIPPGMRAIAIPVSAVDAVGGTIRPGASIDVVAVPTPGRAAPERATEVLATSVLVLDVRTESGSPLLGREPGSAGAVPDRIGSLVIALSPADVLWVADRVTTSTFVIALRAP